jgi:hypothetical protein
MKIVSKSERKTEKERIDTTERQKFILVSSTTNANMSERGKKALEMNSNQVVLFIHQRG